MEQALSRLNVLEIGGGVSAAVAGRALADLGATVVKVEPAGGDPTRRRGPFRAGHPDPEASGAFLYLNANKRSLVLALDTAKGQDALTPLVRRAHLLICDLSPRDAEAQGLAYSRLSALNSRLVLLSLTPYGLHGPYRDYAASDLTLFHGGGWGFLCPGSLTDPGRPPIKPFGQHALVHGGLHGVVAALAACRNAALSGQGELVDVSQQEVVTGLLGRQFAKFPYNGELDDRFSPPPYEPYSYYPTRDGFIYLICPEQPQWERLVELMGSPEWARDDRYSTREGRREHGAALKASLVQWTAQWETEALFHACQQVKVGAAPVFFPDQLERQATLQERGFFVEQEHPVAGRLRLPGAPYKLARPWWALRRPAPLLGEAAAEGERLFAAAHAAPEPDGADTGTGTGPRTASRHPATVAGAQGGAGARAGNDLPLAGVRVLDLSWVWAGPHTTLLLAFLGAEVIKVESSKRPDLTRRSYIYPSGMEPGINRCGYFNLVNQNKRSVAIDLSRPAGQELVRRLAARSDVMISNFGFGVLEKLGLGADVVQRDNPELIVAMISAFGQTGPTRTYSGYGPLICPLAGVSAQTGYLEDGLPQDVGVAYGDPNGGVYGAVAIMAALWERIHRPPGSTGRGQVIDLSMWEAMICTGFEGWMNHALGHPAHAPMGNRDPVWAPHNLYRCAGTDDWVAIAVTEDSQWPALCGVIGREDWAEAPRYRTAAGRKGEEDAIDRAIAAWCTGRERWEVTRLLQAAGVAAFPSMSVRDLLADSHLNARGAFTRWPHPEVGVRTLMGASWRLQRADVNGVGRAAPLLGADTDDVLQTLLGLDQAERARQRAEGVIE